MEWYGYTMGDSKLRPRKRKGNPVLETVKYLVSLGADIRVKYDESVIWAVKMDAPYEINIWKLSNIWLTMEQIFAQMMIMPYDMISEQKLFNI